MTGVRSVVGSLPLVPLVLWILLAPLGCVTQPPSPVDQRLLTAANRGDSAQAQAALQQQADVNVRDERGWTPLIFAARAGDAATVSELLRRGADVNAHADLDETALSVCPARLVPLLAEAGADLSPCVGQAPAIQTPLMRADVEKTRALLAAGAPVDARCAGGGTALHLATDAEKLRLLLAAAADPNPESFGAPTPLMLVAMRGDAEGVHVLLAGGADPAARDHAQQTALHYAAKNLRQGVVAALLAVQPDVNAQSVDGSTPLMLAARDGYTENVRALVAAGADPMIANVNGQSPLDWAMARDDQELVALLKGAGAAEPEIPRALHDLKRADRTSPLAVFISDFLNDGRFAKIRGTVANNLQEPVDGIRYEVRILAGETNTPLETIRRESEVHVDPGADTIVRLDVDSMYFASGQVWVAVKAFPMRVGGRELPPPPGWPE